MTIRRALISGIAATAFGALTACSIGAAQTTATQTDSDRHNNAIMAMLDSDGDGSNVESSEDSTPVSRDEAVHDHVRAMETSFRRPLEEVISDFEGARFSDGFMESMASDSRRQLLETLRLAADEAGGVLLDERDGEIRLTLEGDNVYTVRFRVDDTPPYSIVAMSIDNDKSLRRDFGLTLQNIDEVMARLAREEGFSGVVYVEIDNEVVHRGAYGIANPGSGAPVEIDTIFGIGSRPIDFTVAGILLLAQQERIDLDDPVVNYFEGVPADKSTMTIRHLLNGTSGLPDFHGLPSDWDQDLAWIDRATAESRILAQQLLFAPGHGESHSHSAFGLLAAIIERASGVDYMEFLDRHFFSPASMERTGEYGFLNGHKEDAFAAGGGPSFVGEPNIPPNWGKTSWLVKGSGGMYSTLDDLLRFYDYVRTSGVFEPDFARAFMGNAVNIDGSDRGFELFSIYDEDGQDQAFLFVNMEGPSELFRDISRSLEDIVLRH